MARHQANRENLTSGLKAAQTVRSHHHTATRAVLGQHTRVELSNRPRVEQGSEIALNRVLMTNTSPARVAMCFSISSLARRR